MPAIIPYIPETITVHLGPPDSPAENITVPFVEYIANVASGEIYPTWPEESIRANIYAIITFALNRVFTEYYRSKGYNFDITSTTQYDQSYSKNRETFSNILEIVNEIFNNYIVREGEIQPIFAQFCNGTTSQCAGLSQWGTVNLAEEGLNFFEILQNYYGDNIAIVENAPVQAIEESYPGSPLVLGSRGNETLIIQRQLNRISDNYPAIPKIDISTGIFDVQTQNAVKKFQEIFYLEPNGTVDKQTWYKIKEIYNGVKGLTELTSEGLTFDEVALAFPENLSEGMTGYAIGSLQYYLNVIAYFNPNLNTFPITYVFDPATLNAVNTFQELYSLPVTGVVDRDDWNKIVSVYGDILATVPEGYNGKSAKLYPGYILTPGTSGQNVADLQTYLSLIAQKTGTIPDVKVDGIYGDQTRDAVYTFQSLHGLPAIGSVGPATWQQIAKEYNDLIYAGE